MVGITFPRPVGPYADTKELEYISALLQTGQVLREDGTIQAQDIMHFLSSRHGIRVDEDVVRQAMILELAGSFAPPPLHRRNKQNEDTSNRTAFMDEPEPYNQPQAPPEEAETKGSLLAPLFGKKKKQEEEKAEEELQDPEPVLDLCQLLALLLIPFLRAGNDLLDSAQQSMPGLIGFGLSKRKRHKQEEEQDNEELLGHVLDMALQNILGELRNDNLSQHHHYQHQPPQYGGIENKGVLIDVDRLRDLMELFGEYNLPRSLLEEMIDMVEDYMEYDDDAGIEAGGGAFHNRQAFLNKASFLHALTSDTQLYDPSHVDNHSKPTTHFDDARRAREYQQIAMYGKLGKSGRRRFRRGNNGGGGRRSSIFKPSSKVSTNNNHLEFQQVYTAANIDNNADTYRSTGWFTLVWVETVLLYFAYLTSSTWNVDDVHWMDGCTNEFGCAIAVSLINWTVIFFQLMIMGLTWVFISTLGNAATNPTEELKQKLYTSLRIALGMALVASITAVTFFREHESYFWDTTKNSQDEPAYYSAFIVGCLIMSFQMLRLVGLYVNLGPLGNSGMEDKEQKIKSAAGCKVRMIIEHAVALHDLPPKLRSTGVSKTVLESVRLFHKVPSASRRNKGTNEADISGQEPRGGSTIAKALLNFHRTEDIKEEVGGILWAYKRIYDGSLLWKEGVYFHGRLIAVSILQHFVVLLMVAFFLTYQARIQTFLAGVETCGARWEDFYTVPVVDLNWNISEDLSENGKVNVFVNVFNWNETHFTPDDGETFVEGQFPKYNGSHFRVDGELVNTVCYYDDIAGIEHGGGGGPRNETNTTSTNSNGIWDFTSSNVTDSVQQNGQDGGLPGGDQGGEPGGDQGSGPGGVGGAESALIGSLTSVFTGETVELGGGGPPGGEGEADGGPPPRDDGSNVIHASLEPNLLDEQQSEYLDMLNIAPFEYKLSLIIGLLGAFAGTLGIALSYIPSFVSSVLKMRSGYLPSLKGDHATYFLYRLAPDQTATMFGLAFWGTFFTAAACFILFSLVTFFLVYSKTRDYVITLVSAAIGISTTLGIKVVVMIFLRGAFYSSYYRKKPAASNVMNVILECWSLGLSVGTVATRMAQLLVVTAFYVGRIDTPMLAPGVGNIAGAPLDPAPVAFKKDLLIHEAHRHPFIERLGLLCLLKLHNGKDFGSRAGAHWRLLLVLSVCPWMRNYRVRPDQIDEDDYTDDDEFAKNTTTNRRKRMSVFDNYDPLRSRRGLNQGGQLVSAQEEMERQLEVELAREAYSRVNDQNLDLREALKAAREKLLAANIPLNPEMEEHHLQVLQAPQPKSIYCNVTLWYDDIVGRLVLTKPGIAFYSDALENGVVIRIRWRNFAKHERNRIESPQPLLRLSTKGGDCYEFHVTNRTVRARIRHDITLRLQEYHQGNQRD